MHAKAPNREAREAEAARAPAAATHAPAVALNPALIAALQRTAGNAAVARLLAREPAAPGEPAPPVGAIDPIVDTLWTAELRRQAGTRIGMVFSKFGDAVVELRGEFADRDAEPALGEQLVLAAVGALLPGAIGLTIAHLQKQLKSFALELIKTRPKVGEILTEERVEEVVDAYVALDAADAEQGIRDYLTQGPMPPSGPLGTPVPIGELLDATIDAVHEREEARDTALAGMLRGPLTGVWAQFSARNTSISYFKAQIRDLVAKHEAIAQVAAPGSGYGGIDFEQIVMLDAFGEVNPAVIRIQPSGGIWRSQRTHFVFKEWVSPEMRKAAFEAGQRQQGGMQTITPETPVAPTGVPLQGHIDDPRTEGARIVELDTTSGARLAKVDVEGTGGTFIAWVSATDEAFARAQGNAQPGGIVHMDVCDITGVPWFPGLEDRPRVP